MVSKSGLNKVMSNHNISLDTYFLQAWALSVTMFEAIKWYRKAAEQGFTRAQYNLALMYVKRGRC